MIGTIKAEFRKLLSVRSTYVLMLVALAFVALTSFYVEGYWGGSGSAAGELEPGALQEIAGGSVGIVALFISIVAILQMGHEYRHNTIMYTLTANARRTQVFLAKVFVLGLASIVIGLLTLGFGIAAYYIGLSLRDATLPAQDFELGTTIFRTVVYSFVYGMVGFILVTLMRNLIGAIVLLLMVPITVEPLLGLLLKEKAVYLPFSAFDHIIGAAIMQGDNLTHNAAIGVSFLYIGVTGLIAWLLFVRRDAN